MVAQLNHTIVAARDKHESATFLSEILGLPAPAAVRTFHGRADRQRRVARLRRRRWTRSTAQHYAFLITEEEFDEVFARVQERGITYWPHPWRGNEGTINHNDGGRGFYFEDPSGHFLEVLTRPYGSGS